MSINQSRFSALCQRTLIVVAAVALIAPAATVVELDVITSGPQASAPSSATADAVLTAAVPVEAVEPQVAEYALETTPAEAATAPEGEEPDAHEHDAAEHDAAESHEDEGHEHEGHVHGLPADVDPAEVVSATVSAPVDGFGAVGVTWSPEAEIASDEIALQVRTRVGDEWSDWNELAYHDEHAPDPDSPEARNVRAGTDASVVGDVDEVEVRAEGVGSLPADLQLSVVDPGATETRDEAPAISTDEAPIAAPAVEGIALSSGEITDEAPVADEDPAVSAAKVTAVKPTIFSRAQWGADESIRDKSSLRYGTIQAGFVHHTVNANNYTEAQVPGIIRSIYAYHVKSRGWSDVGYNFLVDRFGRIWEGRAGGVDRAVIGAHTADRNSNSFAGSAIGNFETVAPSNQMIDAYASLMAWKLGANGIAADAKNIRINGKTFQAISGHRDSAATACPGVHLYNRIPTIRSKAKALQGAATAPTPTTPVAPKPTTPPAPQFANPVVQSNLIGTAHPDILVRRASDKKLFAIPTGGLSELAAPATLYKSMSTSTRVFTTPDMNGDRRPDLVSIAKDGRTTIRYGNGKGKFTSGKSSHRGTKGYSLLVAAGDINRDGRADLVGRNAKGQGYAFLRSKANKFIPVKLNRTFKSVTALYAVGDVSGDGYPDLLARRKKDKALVIIRSTGSRTYAPARKLAGSWNNMRDVIGGVDFDKDGKTDIVFRNNDGNIWVLPGLGNGTFESAALGPVARNTAVTALSTAAINGTTNPDVVGRSGKKVVVLKNTGKFEIGAPVSLKISMPTATSVINAGDFNRDGRGDIMAVRSNGQLILRTGDGTGGLSKAHVIGTGFTGVTSIQAVGDVTRDGHPDLMGVQGGVTKIWPGQRTGKLKAPINAPTFKAPLARLRNASSYNPTLYDWKITVSDLRLGAGTTDLVVRERATGRLHVFENTSTGIGSRRYLGRGLGTYDLAG